MTAPIHHSNVNQNARQARAAEEARSHLLDLKGRVAEYEAAAAAALRQAREEEGKAAAARGEGGRLRGETEGARKDIKVR